MKDEHQPTFELVRVTAVVQNSERHHSLYWQCHEKPFPSIRILTVKI